jgi:hypothetical protein
MDAQPAGEALLAEAALALVVASDAAMCALVSAVSAEAAQRAADEAAAAAVAAPSAAALRSLAAASLRAAEAAGAAARGRARVARVCRCARADADAKKREADHARALAVAAMHAALARHDATLCGGAHALKRLCGAASPPPLPAWAESPHPDGVGSDVAAAWRTLAREVVAATPEEELDVAGMSEEEQLAARGERAHGTAISLFNLRLRERFPCREKQLELVGATGEEVAAGKALCA